MTVFGVGMTIVQCLVVFDKHVRAHEGSTRLSQTDLSHHSHHFYKEATTTSSRALADDIFCLN